MLEVRAGDGDTGGPGAPEPGTLDLGPPGTKTPAEPVGAVGCFIGRPSTPPSWVPGPPNPQGPRSLAPGPVRRPEQAAWGLI